MERVNHCPYPYQFKGIYGIDKAHGRALVADEMGLGKSLQALGWSTLYGERRPVLIVCPASLKFNWQNEIRTHLGKDSIILSGKKPYKFPAHEYIIINYDVLKQWAPVLLKEHKPQIMIADELHYCKSRKAIRTKVTIKLGKKIPYFIGLTGTPIDNRPVELFPQLSVITPSLFPNFWDFGFRYCDAKNSFGRWEFKGASHTKELHKKLINTVMIRRKKCDVLKDLPPKIRSVLPLGISMQEYNKAEEDFIGWLKIKDPLKAKSAQNAEALAKIGYLKRLAASGKVKEAVAWIRDFLSNTDEKIILFAVHHEILNQLKLEFGNESVLLTGKTSQKGRKEAVEAFQGDPKVRVFIGGLKAAGVGLTLTTASTIAFLELGWTPAEHLQAESRPHRIGQKNVVKCYYFVAQDTIEVPICDMIQQKQAIIEKIIDGQEEVEDWNVYENLIKTLQRRKK